MRSSVITLGEHRGSPRIYLNGRWLLKAGFGPDQKIDINTEPGRLTITLGNSLKVSSKSSGTVPVIDINNAELRETFKNATHLQVRAGNQTITITPSHTLQQIAKRRRSGTEAALFAGGGFLTEAAKQAGLKPTFAVEVNEDYAQVFERNHPSASMFNMSVSDVPWSDMAQFGPLHVLTLGIPCEPYSVARHWDKGTDADGKQIRRDKSLPNEAHDLGDMVFWALRAVEATNPYTVVIENVTGFLTSGAGFILINALRRMGYTVDSRVVNPVEHGELTTRKRAVIVATTNPAVVWPEAVPQTRTLGDIFDSPEALEGKWFNAETKPWLYKHWAEQTAKGNGFASQQVTADSPQVGTITKRYFAQQGQHPVVKHPTLEGTHRWFTMSEVKRMHGIDDSYYLGDTQTLAGELIGQGVVVSTMRDIIKANL